MTNQLRNRLVTKLPINMSTTYFVVAGIVYIHKSFTTNSLAYRQMVRQADLVVLDSGDIIKNRGIVDVTALSTEIQTLITLGCLEQYDDQDSPALYFLEVTEERLGDILKSIKTTRAIAASTLSLYK